MGKKKNRHGKKPYLRVRQEAVAIATAGPGDALRKQTDDLLSGISACYDSEAGRPDVKIEFLFDMPNEYAIHVSARLELEFPLVRASCEYRSGVNLDPAWTDLDESEVHEKAKELAALISKCQESLLYGLSRLAGDGGLPSEDDALAMEPMPPFSFSCLDENEKGAARAAFKDACKALSKLSGRMSKAAAGGARDVLSRRLAASGPSSPDAVPCRIADASVSIQRQPGFRVQASLRLMFEYPGVGTFPVRIAMEPACFAREFRDGGRNCAGMIAEKLEEALRARAEDAAASVSLYAVRKECLPEDIRRIAESEPVRGNVAAGYRLLRNAFGEPLVTIAPDGTFEFRESLSQRSKPFTVSCAPPGNTTAALDSVSPLLGLCAMVAEKCRELADPPGTDALPVVTLHYTGRVVAQCSVGRRCFDLGNRVDLFGADESRLREYAAGIMKRIGSCVRDTVRLLPKQAAVLEALGPAELEILRLLSDSGELAATHIETGIRKRVPGIARKGSVSGWIDGLTVRTIDTLDGKTQLLQTSRRSNKYGSWTVYAVCDGLLPEALRAAKPRGFRADELDSLPAAQRKEWVLQSLRGIRDTPPDPWPILETISALPGTFAAGLVKDPDGQAFFRSLDGGDAKYAKLLLGTIPGCKAFAKTL